VRDVLDRVGQDPAIGGYGHGDTDGEQDGGYARDNPEATATRRLAAQCLGTRCLGAWCLVGCWLMASRAEHGQGGLAAEELGRVALGPQRPDDVLDAGKVRDGVV
jgi:hypothetical protein